MSADAGTLGTLGAVAIGRNEGERLERCLRSLVGRGATIVYVDSGSTDGSQDFARSLGVEVLALDLATPFTAARARNAGLARLRELDQRVAFVQFVDGDCEVAPGWLEAGRRALAGDATLAAVSGRLRERFPEKSLYNRLADLEWDRPIGEEQSCGGNAMMRVAALDKVGGFDPTLIAGEEPELCARFRAAGYRIMRLADEMALHDIAMTTRAQWMKRARRHGHAVLEVSYFRTSASRGLFVSQIRSAVIWGLIAPLLVACAAMWWLLASVLIAALAGAAYSGSKPPEDHVSAIQHLVDVFVSLQPYVVIPGGIAWLAWVMQMWRIALRASRERRLGTWDALRFGGLTMQSKLSNVRGMAAFLWNRLRGRRQGVIEYKAAPPADRERRVQSS